MPLHIKLAVRLLLVAAILCVNDAEKAKAIDAVARDISLFVREEKP